MYLVSVAVSCSDDDCSGVGDNENDKYDDALVTAAADDDCTIGLRDALKLIG